MPQYSRKNLPSYCNISWIKIAKLETRVVPKHCRIQSQTSSHIKQNNTEFGKKKSSMYWNFEKVYKIQEFLPLTVQDQFPKFLNIWKKETRIEDSACYRHRTTNKLKSLTPYKGHINSSRSTNSRRIWKEYILIILLQIKFGILDGSTNSKCMHEKLNIPTKTIELTTNRSK